MKKYDVVALGEVLIDFTPAGKSEKGMDIFERNPGGAPANVLATVTKLGGSSAFIGKIGRDAHGDFLAESMKNSGIELKGLRIDESVHTTLAFVTLDANGDRSFSFYRNPGADVTLTFDEVDTSLIDDTKIFHFGSVSLTDEPVRSATLEAAKYARKHGAIVSYDPNYRPPLWHSEEEASEVMKKALPLADIIKVSDYELELLTGESDLDKGAERLLSFGACLVLISMGPKGAYFNNGKAKELLKTYDVATVDTTGAGDAFLGSILYKLCDMTTIEIANLDKDKLHDIVDYGNACGSLTTTKTGAAPAIPTANEVELCRQTIKLMNN